MDNLGVQFDFDFVDHKFIATVTNGSRSGFALEPMTVADFYARFLALTDDLQVRTEINRMPNEVPNAVPFERDKAHASYDADAVHRFWQALVQIDRVLKYFRTGFLGKASPVHLFWGSFDLAVTRFSGRRAPQHTGGVPGLPDGTVTVTQWLSTDGPYSVCVWTNSHTIATAIRASSSSRPSGSISASL